MVADLLLVARSIVTLADGRAPEQAQAVAVAGGKVLAVGAEAELRRFVGPGTRVDRRDAVVVPGLVDSHCHFTGLGWALSQLDVTGAESPEAVAAAAAARPGEGWVQGRGWDQTTWAPAEFPTHAPLSAAQPDRPVVLRRVDGHATWANAEAMRRAGITRDTADPPGGLIVRDAAGDPTGVFIDAAMPLVEGAVPPPDDAEVGRWADRALAACRAAGLTGVHETGSSAQMIRVYRQRRLPLRIHALLDAADPDVAALVGAGPDPDPFVAVRGYKLFVDGALGSRGAWLSAPYSDDPSTSGLALLQGAGLDAAIAPAAAQGFQIGVHGIDDAAITEILDAYTRLGAAGRRWRIEHAQIVRPADVGRFTAMGVIAPMQPTHATSDWRWAERRLGPERIRWAYAWRTLIDAGVRVPLGSDFPIEAPDPVAGLYAAVTRQDATGQPAGGWYPAEALSAEEALRGWTIEPAYASFTETHRGRVAPGFDADFTLLSDDPRRVSPAALARIRPLGVVVAGR